MGGSVGRSQCVGSSKRYKGKCTHDDATVAGCGVSGRRATRPSASDSTSNRCCSSFGLGVFLRVCVLFLIRQSCFKLNMSSRQPSPQAPVADGRGKRKAGGRDQHANQREPSPTASAISGATDSGGPAKSRWLVSSPSEGGMSVGLPRATVQQIVMLDNRSGTLRKSWAASATAWIIPLPTHQGAFPTSPRLQRRLID